MIIILYIFIIFNQSFIHKENHTYQIIYNEEKFFLFLLYYTTPISMVKI